MAKIAVALSRALEERARLGAPGQTTGHVLAQGEGWTVRDVICTCGPQDREFEEQHSQISIAVVVAGTFQYQSSARGSKHRELMTPGSLLLGNPSQYFECGHEHAAGDRCISFQYAPEYFQHISADIGTKAEFHILRIPPLRSQSAVVARACAALAGAEESATTTNGRIPHGLWEEFAIELAARAVRLAASLPRDSSAASPHALARITEIARNIEEHPDSRLTLANLARESSLSPYHFLRMFRLVTGVTPHQYILRARLRAAAVRLGTEPDKILDAALDSGFGDVSNFNHAFRAEFGMSPREYRRSGNGVRVRNLRA